MISPKLISFSLHWTGIGGLFGNVVQLTDLPFSLYSTFVIEARHGFNKVRILTWIFFSLLCLIISWLKNCSLWYICLIADVTSGNVKFLTVWCFFCFISHVLSLHYILTLFFLVLQQTIWLFFRDMIKGMILAIVLGPPIVSTIIIIVQVWTSSFFNITSNLWLSV